MDFYGLDGRIDDFSESYDTSNLPPYACSYCGFASVSSVSQCLTCNRWFCNSVRPQFGSHIIFHLARTRHLGIKLHKNNPLEDIVLECYNCSQKNVFNLGYIPATEESAVILLCRNCLRHPNTKTMGWDVNEWKSIICEKSFLEWLLLKPDCSSYRNPEPNQLSKLEDAWKSDLNATLDTLARVENNNEIQSVKLKYEDPVDYKNTFMPLIELESANTKKLKTACNQEGVNIKWINTVAYILAEFNIPLSDEDNLWDIYDELLISTCESFNKIYSGKGSIIDINEGKILVQMFDKNVPVHITTGYKVEYAGNEVPFTRMINALKIFSTSKRTILSDQMYYEILGTIHHNDMTFQIDLPKDFHVDNLPPLNSSQLQAVKSSLLNPLTLIQGPPGTGKTVTSASIVYHVAKSFKQQILVCAPSNIAVDHLAGKIEKTGLRVVRVLARNKEEVLDNVKGFLLHKLILQLPGEYTELNKLNKLKEETGELKPDHEDRYRILKNKAEKLILQNAEVICCTCSCAGDNRLNSIKIRHVLIDEATQAPEPDTLIPIVKGCEHLILVGDHKQLGPVILDDKAKAAGFGKSLFERFIKLKYKPIVLTVQYRMHPKLSMFPSEAFYTGALQNGITESQRKSETTEKFPFPNPSFPMLFLSCEGTEELSSTGTSYLNRLEATRCEEIVNYLLENGTNAQAIGVISPYEGQRIFLQRYILSNGVLPKEKYDGLEIANVDAFQGREKDYVVLSCVRSNENLGIGFLKDTRRLNVAITRSKYGLIIIGNARVLCKYPVWHQLLYHCQQHKCIVEGELNRQSPLSFEVPKPPPLVNKNDYEVAYESNETDLDKEKMVDFLSAMTNIKYEPIQLTAWTDDIDESDEDDQKLVELDFA